MQENRENREKIVREEAMISSSKKNQPLLMSEHLKIEDGNSKGMSKKGIYAAISYMSCAGLLIHSSFLLSFKMIKFSCTTMGFCVCFLIDFGFVAFL